MRKKYHTISVQKTWPYRVKPIYFLEGNRYYKGYRFDVQSQIFRNTDGYVRVHLGIDGIRTFSNLREAREFIDTLLEGRFEFRKMLKKKAWTTRMVERTDIPYEVWALAWMHFRKNKMNMSYVGQDEDFVVLIENKTRSACMVPKKSNMTIQHIDKETGRPKPPQRINALNFLNIKQLRRVGKHDFDGAKDVYDDDKHYLVVWQRD